MKQKAQAGAFGEMMHMVENVIWPAYLDEDRSRGEGRRVPRDLSVPDPTVEEIAAAVKQIGYDATVEWDKRYPRDHRPTGCVIVKGTEDTSKNDLVQAIGAYLVAIRDQDT